MDRRLAIISFIWVLFVSVIKTEVKSNNATDEVDEKTKRMNAIKEGDKPYIPFGAAYRQHENFANKSTEPPYGKDRVPICEIDLGSPALSSNIEPKSSIITDIKSTSICQDSDNSTDPIYLFSSNLRGHVVNTSYGLLLSQKKHLQNVTKQFGIVDNRTNIFELKKMDAVLFSLEVVVEKELKSLQGMIKNFEQLTPEEKVDPIEEVSIVCLLSAWTQMLNLIGRIKIDDKIKGVEEQIDKMKKIIDIACVELRLYERAQEERLKEEEEKEKSKTSTTPEYE